MQESGIQSAPASGSGATSVCLSSPDSGLHRSDRPIALARAISTLHPMHATSLSRVSRSPIPVSWNVYPNGRILAAGMYAILTRLVGSPSLTVLLLISLPTAAAYSDPLRILTLNCTGLLGNAEKIQDLITLIAQVLASCSHAS